MHVYLPIKQNFILNFFSSFLYRTSLVGRFLYGSYYPLILNKIKLNYVKKVLKLINY
jgi:hypothetical protein